MKRSWAVFLTAAVLTGCRGGQPATNPFLRTTVPPPATGQGMMVMPGEAYPAAGVSPVVTMPAVPPAVSPAIPVTPVPLIAPPPPLGPQGQKFQPPGGSYLYHQSSNDHPDASNAGNGAEAALAAVERHDLPAANVQSVAEIPAPQGTIRQAGYLVDRRSTVSTGAAHQVSSLAFDQPTSRSRGDPPEGVATLWVGQTGGSSTVRVVGESSAVTASGASSTATPGVFRMTAGDSRPAASTSNNASQPSTSRIAIVMPATVSHAVADVSGPDRGAGGVTKAAFQPVATTDYAHAADYGTLRGQLEYSQSLRQWKLRYIPIDGLTDAYGGSVVLSAVAGMKSYRPGDLVVVRGSLVGGSAASSGISPRYELEAIEPLSR